MAETIRDVTIRIRIEQTKSPPLKVPGIQEFQKEVDLGKQKVGQLADKLGQASDAAVKLGVEGVKAGVEVLDKFKTAGEGVFTFARGIAFAFSSTDEGFQRMIANVVKVQAGFDLFKGSIDTIKGVTEGLIALKVATGAATVAQAIQTTTIKGLTKAMVVLRGAVIAMTASIGAIALTLSVVTLGVFALKKAWDAWTRDAGPSTAELADDLARINEATSKNLSTFDRRIVAAERLRNVEADRQTIVLAIRDAELLAFERAETDAERLLIRKRALAALEEDSLARQKESLSVAEKTANVAKSELQTARSALDLEEGKLLSRIQQFGLLDPTQRREVKRAAERQATGQGTIRGLRLLQPFAPKLFAKEAERRGIEEGAESFFRQLGELEPLEQLQQKENRLAGTAQLTQETEEKAVELVQGIERGLVNIFNLIDLINEKFRDDQQRGQGLTGI